MPSLKALNFLGALVFAAPCAVVAQSSNSPGFALALGANVPDCEKLLAGANQYVHRSRISPPEGKQFVHAISWRELKRIPGVQDAQWKPLEAQHIEPLALATVQFNLPRVAAYIHFLDQESPWLKGPSAWPPPSSWEKVKTELTEVTSAALRRFLERGGTVGFVAFKDANPYYTGTLGIAQFEHRTGSPPFPGPFMKDEVSLDPSMATGIDTATFAFSSQVLGGVGVDHRYFLFEQQPFGLSHGSGATRLQSAGRAPMRDCLIARAQ